jgi:hypothetical protein
MASLRVGLLKNWHRYGFEKPVYGIVDIKELCFTEMDFRF